MSDDDLEQCWWACAPRLTHDAWDLDNARGRGTPHA
jgi:hypothetical protein